uniref:Uncharacterized protein n=1 Tax=Anopheles maculatus TaxID=74869 RepID=A0A182T187_9DIPT
MRIMCNNNTGGIVYRFQYEIPTVGQHYGNAFHLAEDDDEVRDFLVEHQRYGTDVHNIMEEHIAEDEEEEEDIEMSTAVEVISIDPNCDYDTDEEDDEEEEEEDEHEEDVKCEIEVENETVQKCENGESGKVAANFQPHARVNVAMLNAARNVTLPVDWPPAMLGSDGDVHELYRSVRDIKDDLVDSVDRSRSRNSSNTDSSSTSSSSRDSSTSSTYVSDKDSCNQLPFVSTRQSEEQEKGAVVHQYHHQSYHSEDEEDDEDEDEDEEDDDDPGLDFSPSKNTLWELPAKLLQDTSGPKKTKTQPHGRRKRCSTSQRQSFSMPHSPVGAGTVESGPVIGGGLLPTSLSFDDLDSLVCDLSPMKNLPTGKASSNELEEDDALLADPLANTSNFDLTAYITGDDDTTSCEINGQRKVEPIQSPPKRVLPKSRGKELKVLRQHMLPREHQHNDANPEPLSNGKRDSAAKAVRKLTMEDESSDAEDEQLVALQTNSKRVDNRNETRGIRRGSKRKLVDDTDKDPTWNPNGGSSSSSSSSKNKFEPK